MMRRNAGPNRCNVEFSPGEYCRHYKMKGSQFCHVHQNVSTRVAPSEEQLQAEFRKQAEKNSHLAHHRVVDRLIKAGAKIITVGSEGYPDVLFTINDRIFAIEVKDKYDRLGSRQRAVIDALRRLERVEVIRESGDKRKGELSIDEFLRFITE